MRSRSRGAAVRTVHTSSGCSASSSASCRRARASACACGSSAGATSGATSSAANSAASAGERELRADTIVRESGLSERGDVARRPPPSPGVGRVHRSAGSATPRRPRGRRLHRRACIEGPHPPLERWIRTFKAKGHGSKTLVRYDRYVCGRCVQSSITQSLTPTKNHLRCEHTLIYNFYYFRYTWTWIERPLWLIF